MSYQATKVQDRGPIDYQNGGTAVAPGKVVAQGNLVGIATRGIPANALGALDIEGVFDVAKKEEEITAGAPVYWDDNGNPYLGEAGTGCASKTKADGPFMGRAVELSAATVKTVRVLLATVDNEYVDPG